MEVFELIVNEKVSVWRRSRVKVLAESLEEAVDKCVTNSIYCAEEICDSEYLEETEQYLPQDDFNNPVTIEVMNTDYKTLKTNEYR